MNFKFAISQCVQVHNRHRIAFEESLRVNPIADIPVTSQLLLKGCNITSLNLVPELQPVACDPDCTPDCGR